MIYLCLYGILIALVIIDAISPFKRKESIRIMNVLIVIFTLFRGLRWETGTDWNQFYYCYMHSSFNNIFSFHRYGAGTELMEYGYMFFNAVFHSILPYTYFLLAFNFLILYLYKLTVLKMMKSYFILVYCFLIITVAFFPMRQEMANTIILFSIPFFLDRNWKVFIVLCLLAVSIHKSAFIIIPFFFLLYKKFIPSHLLIGIYLSSYIIELPAVQVLVQKMTPYLLLINDNYEHGISVYSNHVAEVSEVFKIGTLIMNLLLISLFCLMRDNVFFLKKNITYNFLLNIFVIYLFGFRLFQNIGLTYFGRIMKYLFFADSFLFGYLLISLPKLRIDNSFKNMQLNYYIVTCLIFALSINRFWSSCKLYPETSFPYISVLDKQHRDLTPKEPSIKNFFE